MYQPMLFLHWKQVKLGLIPFMIASFGLPLLSVQGLGTPPGATAISYNAVAVAATGAFWEPFYMLMAASTGILLALSAWNWDHSHKHVYALSLPVSRAQYALLKMSAGALLAVLPAGAFWLGAHTASLSVSLPSGLNAYPNALAFRFFLTVLLSYAAWFTLAAGTVRTTLWVLSGLVSVVVLALLANDLLAASGVEFFIRHNVVELAVEMLQKTGGPLEILTGNWRLIDV